jgi:membrane protein required for colicin V production
MHIVDYLLIAIVVISVVIGAMRGFLREAVSLASWVLALLLAWHFGHELEPHLGAWLAQYPHALAWTARGIVFLAVILLGAVVGGLLGHFVRLSIFSGLDRFLGMVFGALRGLVAVGLLVILGQLLRINEESWWTHSVLMPHAERIANGLRVIVGEHLPIARESVT